MTAKIAMLMAARVALGIRVAARALPPAAFEAVAETAVMMGTTHRVLLRTCLKMYRKIYIERYVVKKEIEGRIEGAGELVAIRNLAAGQVGSASSDVINGA
ncbi:hypothetical protein C3Y08_34460 [Burkholderia gladioli]|nr:hypothetical protein C3Y08_34460 [Burkholderia gladioli]